MSFSCDKYDEQDIPWRWAKIPLMSITEAVGAFGFLLFQEFDFFDDKYMPLHQTLCRLIPETVNRLF